MTVEEYLANAPEPHRSTLLQVRARLQRILPEAVEGLSYGVPAFKVDGTPVAGYAHHKNHCGYYPHSTTVLAALSDDLEGYNWFQGTLQFPVDEPLPESLLAKLVRARLRELNP